MHPPRKKGPEAGAGTQRGGKPPARRTGRERKYRPDDPQQGNIPGQVLIVRKERRRHQLLSRPQGPDIDEISQGGDQESATRHIQDMLAGESEGSLPSKDGQHKFGHETTPHAPQYPHATAPPKYGTPKMPHIRT